MKYHYRAAIPEQAGPLLYRPIVEIEIVGPKGRLRELALIDSGADCSMLNSDIADIVGIDLTQATARRAIGITRATTVYLTEVELKLGGARGVSVHVVTARHPGQAASMPRIIWAPGPPDPLPTSHLGAYPPRGTGIHPRAGAPGGSAGGDGPTAAGAGAADRAHLVAPPVARPPPGPGPTAAASAHGAPPGRTARPCRAGTGVGARSGGGRRGPRHAGALSALPAPGAGRGAPAPAASGDREPARAAGGDRVAVAPRGLSGLWRGDPRGGACGWADGGLRPAGPGEHGPGYGGRSAVEPPHAARPGRDGGRPAGAGDDRPPGARDGAGGSRARGGGPGVCPTATGGRPG